MEKRVLKLQKNRKPKDNYSVSQLKTDVAKAAGFTRRDTSKVIDEVWKHIGDALMNKQTFHIPKVAILYPCIKPPRVAVALRDNFDNPEKIQLPATWRLRIQPSSSFQNELAKVKVSKRELDNCYRTVKTEE